MGIFKGKIRKMIFDPKDYIYIDSWKKLVDKIGGKLVYRNMEQVPEFFKEIKGTGKKVILVSGACDYTVCEQEKYHPNFDLVKLAQSVQWNEFNGIKDKYCKVDVGPACTDKCSSTDKYSLKTDRFTWATFNEIPDEVEHWYTTNLNIEHKRCSLLPFGLNTDGPGSSFIPFFTGKKKTKTLYINFQDNTLERVLLKMHYSDQDWVTLMLKANVPVAEYLEHISYHQYIMCPFGNGWDSYRTLETIYLGSIPIMGGSIFTEHLSHLFPLVTTELAGLDKESLEKVLNSIPSGESYFNGAKLSWWENKFKELNNA